MPCRTNSACVQFLDQTYTHWWGPVQIKAPGKLITAKWSGGQWHFSAVRCDSAASPEDVDLGTFTEKAGKEPPLVHKRCCEATAATAEVFRFGTQWKFFCREQDEGGTIGVIETMTGLTNEAAREHKQLKLAPEPSRDSLVRALTALAVEPGIGYFEPWLDRPPEEQLWSSGRRLNTEALDLRVSKAPVTCGINTDLDSRATTKYACLRRDCNWLEQCVGVTEATSPSNDDVQSREIRQDLLVADYVRVSAIEVIAPELRSFENFNFTYREQTSCSSLRSMGLRVLDAR
ncbi:hypothetical protein AK812_SmicGene20576 [Symbiodinium microadriaticum]|uniref:Uncharacterized protein n=1 Tax=Symbiodinium microadriaticum TaxID=2951 RepID=A0A1Q9DPM9_SYMMI|nr:hypothetical protein AK812_SmicGene20576 [Symbiodinium microadriaticum]